MKIKYFLILFFIISLQIKGQDNFFEKTYGLGRGASIYESQNGNFIIGSHVGDFPNGQAFYFIVNGHGDTLQTFSYANATLNCVRQTADSGFIFIGDSCCERTACVYKTDRNGNIQWKTAFISEENGTWGAAVIPVENNYFVGYVNDGDGSENYCHIVKLDSIGRILRDTVLNNVSTGFLLNPNFMNLTADKGIISVVTFYVGGIHLFRIDSSNNILWRKRFRDTSANYIFDGSIAIETNNNNYLIIGSKNSLYSETNKGLLIVTNSSGDSLWSKIYEFPNASLNFKTGIEDSYGNYYIAGNYSSTSTRSLILLKTNSNGDTLWTRQFLGLGKAYPSSITLDSLQNPVIIGSTADSINQFYIYLVKADTSGNIITEIIENNNQAINRINIYPNPVRNVLYITQDKKELIKTINIFNSIGQKQAIVYSSSKHGEYLEVNTISLTTGVYFLEMISDKQKIIKRFVKE